MAMTHTQACQGQLPSLCTAQKCLVGELSGGWNNCCSVCQVVQFSAGLLNNSEFMIQRLRVIKESCNHHYDQICNIFIIPERNHVLLEVTFPSSLLQASGSHWSFRPCGFAYSRHFVYMESDSMWSFVAGCFHLAEHFQCSPKWEHGLALHSSLWLNIILLYGHSTCCFSIHILMAI